MSSTQAQNLVSFQAKTNAKQVILGDHFQVFFTVNHSKASHFSPPPFIHFEQLSGINRSSSTRVMNGKASVQVTYSYFLKPKKVGTIEIGKASIEIDGKKFFTSPISIEVLKSNPEKGAVPKEKKIFVKAELNTSEVVSGQPIILDYKVYTTIPVEHYSIVNEPSYEGFLAIKIRRFNAIATKEVINGVAYTSKIIQRIALYPQQTGKHNINPMRFRVAVPDPKKSGHHQPFGFMKPTQTLFIASNALEIDVKPLPSPAPNSFSGAVGKYTANAAIDKATATTDDAITLQLRVDGDGDIKRVTAPNLVLSDTFEVYDPNVISENQTEQNGKLRGTKIFEYLILPKYAGKYTITPQFSYFDTDSLQFVTLSPNTFEVEITKGQYNTNVNQKPVVTKEEKAEIHGIQTNWNVISRSHFVGSPLFWGLLAVPILAFIAAIGYKNYLKHKPEVDIVALKKDKAQKVAKQRLSKAETFLNQGNNRSFYDEVSKSLLGYASDKFNILGSELKKTNVEQHLHSSGAKKEHISEFISLLQTCERAVYAPSGQGDAHAVYEKALSVITEIER